MSGLRTGVVGHTGRGNFGHKILQGFQASPMFDLLAIADAGAPDAAANGVRRYPDVLAMLESERLDVVVVAQRYTDTHHAAVTAALAAGCHVYCEKPLTPSLEEGDELVALAAERGLVLAAALPAVHEPRFRALRGWIADGLVGDVWSARGLTKWDHRGGGEDALILGVHMTDMMRRLLGDATTCAGRVTTAGRSIAEGPVREAAEGGGLVAGDRFHAAYTFAQGITGTVESVRADIEDRAEHPYRLELRGTLGILSFRAPYADGSVWHYPHPEVLPGREGLWRLLHLQATPYEDYHRWAAEDLYRAVTTGQAPACSGADAVAALEMIHAAYWSEREGGSVALPLKNRAHPLADLVVDEAP